MTIFFADQGINFCYFLDKKSKVTLVIRKNADDFRDNLANDYAALGVKEKGVRIFDGATTTLRDNRDQHCSDEVIVSVNCALTLADRGFNHKTLTVVDVILPKNDEV